MSVAAIQVVQCMRAEPQEAHNHFTALLDSVRDHPDEPAPEK